MSVRAWVLMLGVLCWQGNAQAQAQPASKYETDPASYRLIADELKELERARAEIGLGGPIALTITGGATAGLGAGFLLFGLLLESMDCDETVEPVDDYDTCTSGDFTPLIVLGTVGVVAGAVMLAIALPTMFSRIDQRRSLGIRIKELRRELGRASSESGHPLARTSTVLKLRF